MNAPMYPKTYATVTHVGTLGRWVVAVTDGGEAVSLMECWQQGGDRVRDTGAGTRIKVYQRPTEDHPVFKPVGA